MSYILNDTTGLNLTLQKLGIVQQPDLPCTLNLSVTPPLGGFDFALIFFAFMAVMIFAHEFGHWWALRKHFPNTKVSFGMWEGERFPKIWTGSEEEFEKLTPEQKIEVYMHGIIFGIVPIVVAVFINIVFLALIVPYILGIQNDIRLIRANQIEIKERNQ